MPSWRKTFNFLAQLLNHFLIEVNIGFIRAGNAAVCPQLAVELSKKFFMLRQLLQLLEHVTLHDFYPVSEEDRHLLQKLARIRRLTHFEIPYSVVQIDGEILNLIQPI